MVLHVGLTYNLAAEIPSGKPDDFYAEYDSSETITSIKKALHTTNRRITLIEADENAYEKLKKQKPDIVFNIAEGKHGESRESHIPSMLEMLGIPYTGSGPLTLAITLNKAKTKEVLTYHGVPTPHSQVFKTPDEALDERLDFPLIVKPLEDGSSRGISTDSLVRDEKELANKITQINTIYNQPALAEKFLPGREFTVAVLGNKKAYTLPIVEIYLHKYPKESRGVYGYEAKTKWEKDEYSGHPEKIDDDLKEKIIELALKTHEALDCKDYSRIDIRLDEQGRPNVLEANPLPGLNPKIEAVSYFPKAARLAGMTFTELINKMLAIGLERNGITEQEGLEKQVSPKAAT